MEIVNAEEFFGRTFGGRPPKANMGPYQYKRFACGCGETHFFSASTCDVLRQLKGTHFVIGCPNEKALIYVKITMLKTKLITQLAVSHDEVDTFMPEDFTEVIQRRIEEALA